MPNTKTVPSPQKRALLQDVLAAAAQLPSNPAAYQQAVEKALSGKRS